MNVTWVVSGHALRQAVDQPKPLIRFNSILYLCRRWTVADFCRDYGIHCLYLKSFKKEMEGHVWCLLIRDSAHHDSMIAFMKMGFF